MYLHKTCDVIISCDAQIKGQVINEWFRFSTLPVNAMVRIKDHYSVQWTCQSIITVLQLKQQPGIERCKTKSDSAMWYSTRLFCSNISLQILLPAGFFQYKKCNDSLEQYFNSSGRDKADNFSIWTDDKTRTFYQPVVPYLLVQNLLLKVCIFGSNTLCLTVIRMSLSCRMWNESVRLPDVESKIKSSCL